MDLKERVITEVLHMFHDSGIKAVRMDDIAEACGISKRTLYENFSDREDLIRQSLRYYAMKYGEYIQEKMKDARNAIDEFWIIFSVGLNIRPSNIKVMKDLMKFYPAIFEDFMKTHHLKVHEENKQRLERGIEQGLILKKIDTDFISRTFTSYISGMKKDFEDYSFSHMENTNPTPRSLQFAVMLFFRGITTEEGRKYIDENILTDIE